MIDKNSALWQYLTVHQRELLEDGEYLFKEAEEEKPFYDYSFLVFPYAKAYEGFLKKLFFDLNFIDQRTYHSDRFRIGKALNPQLERHLRHESIYDKLVNYCQGEDLAKALWDVWKRGRNLLFHYFPRNEHKITISEAKLIRDEMIAVMEKALANCSVKKE